MPRATSHLVSRNGLSPGLWDQLCRLAVAAAVATAGCSSQPREPESAATFRIGARGKAETPRVLAASFFAEPLLVIDWQGRPSARLATSWQWEDSGHTLRLKLRPSVRFHDGKPLTAPLVAAILTQQIRRPNARGFEAVDGIEAADDLTVVIRLRTPDAFLIGALGGTLIVDERTPDIGTGPFRIVSRTPAIEVSSNDSYYRGSPAIKRVSVVPYETPRAAWAGLMKGDVEMAHEVSRESVEFTTGTSRVNLYSSIKPFYIPLVFNLDHPVLRRVEVRRALSEAINREEILSHALRGHGQVADDPVWPYHWAYSPAARRYSFSPGTASLRLDAAGLPIKIVPGSDGMARRFTISCLFWNEDPQFERIALLLQRQFAQIGVDLVLQGGTEQELARRANSGQFETYLFQMTSGRSFEWTYRFWHSSPSGRPAEIQDTGYSGADAVLDELRLALSESEIRAAVGDMRQRFYDDAPAAFLAWTQITRAVDARFDVGDRSDPEIFANLWRWRPGSTQQALR